MAKLPRVHQKIFAENAISKEIGQFGSAVAGAKKETGDIAEIQALDAWGQGWSEAAVSKNRYPALQEDNGVKKTVTQQLAYIFQEGIPEWHKDAEYFRGSLVKVLSGNEIKLYISLQDNNIGHAITEPDWWEEIQLGCSSKIGDPVPALNNTLEDNEIWLEGAVVSRETYAKLFEVYGTTYGAGDGTTTFQLPDVRNRVFWGSNSFGYINAALPNIKGQIIDIIGGMNSSANGFIKQTRKYSEKLYGSVSGPNFTDFSFNASTYSAIYKDGTNTVQPPGLKVRVKTRYK